MGDSGRALGLLPLPSSRISSWLGSACCASRLLAPCLARHAVRAVPAGHAGELLDLVRGGELAGAVSDCLAAAAAELDPLKQAALLKASCYGRAFRQLEAQQAQREAQAQQGLPGGGDPRRQTVEVARRLRVLNALREPGAPCPFRCAGIKCFSYPSCSFPCLQLPAIPLSGPNRRRSDPATCPLYPAAPCPLPPAGIGMPLTMPQLAAEGLPAVVSRLVGRRHYLLAMRVCQALGLPTEQVRGVPRSGCPALPFVRCWRGPRPHCRLPSDQFIV